MANLSSIYLNVLPRNTNNKLDVLHLEHLDKHLPQEFIKLLLNKEDFKLTLSYNNAEKPLHSLDDEDKKKLQQVARCLDKLFIDNKDNFLEYGTKVFGFGYPILLRRSTKDPDKIINAPLFIWNLGIEKVENQLYTWKIGRNEEMPIYINPILLNFLEQDTGLNLKKWRLDYADCSFIKQQELTDICNQLLQQLNADNEYAIPTIALCPNKETIKHIGINKILMRWSGVLSLYKMPKQSIIADIEALLGDKLNESDQNIPEVNNELTILSHELDKEKPNHNTDDITRLAQQEKYLTALNKQHNFEQLNDLNSHLKISAIATDPSQQLIVNNLFNHDHEPIIIQGPPGTGKSQSLTAILTRALLEGKRCLVVCEKRAALEILQYNLSNLGLSDLSILIEDSNKDRQKVIDAARRYIDEPKKIPLFNADFYAKQEKNVVETAQFIQNQHQFLNKYHLNKEKWTDLVGKFCLANALQDKSILDKYLFDAGLLFNFDGNTYQHLQQVVANAQPLFEAINTIAHPLALINNNWYKEKMSGEMLQNITQYSQRFSQQLNLLLQNAEKLTADYTHELKNYFNQFAQQSKALCQNILDSITKINSQYPNEFEHLQGIKFKLSAIIQLFSHKHKQVFENIATIKNNFDDLNKQFELFFDRERQLISPNLLPHKRAMDNEKREEILTKLSAIQIATQQIQQDINNWESQETNILTNYLQQFEAEKLHHCSQLQSAINGYWLNYQQTMSNINKSELFNITINTNENNVTKSLNDLYTGIKILLAQLNTIQAHLPKFKQFYEWQHFYLNQNEQAQQLLLALTKTKSSNWVAAFDSWYLNNWLIRLENTYTPNNEQQINQLDKTINDINPQLIAAILQYWQTERSKNIKAFNEKQNGTFNAQRLYNKRSTQGNKRSTLRQIIYTDFALFTSFFPVCLVNPIVCSTIFPLTENLFDIVIFDEAGQLRIEDTYPSLYRGKNKIVSGDIHQMNPSNYFMQSKPLLYSKIEEEDNEDEDISTQDLEGADSESLLTYAEDNNYKSFYLDFHYRSQHPHLIDFSNAAFYNTRLMPMPAQKNYAPIQLQSINGLYKDKTNEDEANAIINYLLDSVTESDIAKYKKNTANKEKETANNDTFFDDSADNTVLPNNRTSEGINNIGIATFNLHQRNLILFKLQQIKAQDGIAAQKIIYLERNGLFVKNLENIQGDERDLILISTTFGKSEQGKFIQNFGHINREMGYRLLNVIITRARKQLVIFTSIPIEYYSNYKPTNTNEIWTGKHYLYAYLNYAQAVTTQNEAARQQILAQLNQIRSTTNAQQISNNNNHSNANNYGNTANEIYRGKNLIDHIATLLREHLPENSVKTYYTQGGIIIPLAIFSPTTQQPLLAIECDYAPFHHSSVAYMYDIVRTRYFSQMGFQTLHLYSVNWWLNPEQSLQSLLQKIKSIGG